MWLVSCQKGPTRHAHAWQIGPFWQDTLNVCSSHKHAYAFPSLFCCGYLLVLSDLHEECLLQDYFIGIAENYVLARVVVETKEIKHEIYA